jgi:hypothetical protein
MVINPINNSGTQCPTVDFSQVKPYIPDRKSLIIDGIIANLCSFMVLLLLVYLMRHSE